MALRIIGQTSFLLARVLLPALLLSLPALANAGDIVKFDGRHYQVVVDKGITWEDAEAAAKEENFDGVRGHLATITSEAEDVFLEGLRGKAGLSRPEVWVGGFQQPCDAGLAREGCGWTWLNDEGPISTPQAPLLSYSNWLDGEPNDNSGPGSEEHLAIGLRGNFGWNDEGSLGNIGGYVIEFDTSTLVDPNDCIEGDGCETTAGQVLLLPAVELEEGASIGVRTFEFTDDPGRCGQDPLVLFGGEDSRPDLVIPPYLCGSPRFLVVEVDRQGFDVSQGTILIENEPLEALPGNLYECTGPLDQESGATVDPQYRDVVAWQATDLTTMLENDLGATVDPQFAGALGEFTFECGSSRGLTKTASYFVIGLHINFGPGFDLAENSAGNHERFVALTRYKLLLLQTAVEESEVALKRGDLRKMKTKVDNAIRFHDQGQFESALQSIELFLKFADRADYSIIPSENYEGEHLMRASNIRFMLEEKVIPFAP